MKSYKKELLDRAEAAIERGPRTEDYRRLGGAVFKAIKDEAPDRQVGFCRGFAGVLQG